MRRRAFIGFALLALSHFAFANVSSALAQAGSTGGTIGKQDKSISGDGPIPSRQKTKSSKHRSGADGGAAIVKGQKTFQNPMSNGMRTDLCQTAIATGCGEASANMWCKRKGYTHAIAFNWGYGAPAWRQAEGSICTGPCGILTDVTCE
jgi:hypothetical protein